MSYNEHFSLCSESHRSTRGGQTAEFSILSLLVYTDSFWKVSRNWFFNHSFRSVPHENSMGLPRRILYRWRYSAYSYQL